MPVFFVGERLSRTALIAPNPRGTTQSPAPGKVLATPSQSPLASRLWRRVPIILEHAAEHQRHFGKATPAREALQTTILIANINRVVQTLDSDIAAEEEQARAF